MDINIPNYIMDNLKAAYKNKEIVYKNLSLKDYYLKSELRNLDKIIELNLNSENNKNLRSNIILDIKIKNYKKKDYTCFIKDWHLDGGKKSSLYRENVYYIFCIGAPTEFIKQGQFNLPQSKTISNTLIPKNLISQIPSSCWYKYGEREYHRGPKITQDLHRIWIRITYSDYIKTIKQ